MLCGRDHSPKTFGLTPEGAYDEANAFPNELSLRISHFGGRGKLYVERLPLPLPFALGMRAALRAALDRVDADLAAAGVVFDDEARAG